jgi:hypothetical protein
LRSPREAEAIVAIWQIWCSVRVSTGSGGVDVRRF